MNGRIKTIILCGGMGTRLREETEFKPKPMVQIGDKPILWHIMKIYAHFGFGDFILALGYKGSCIKDYFLKHRYYTHDFSFNPTQENNVNFLKNNSEEDNFNIIFAETGLETPHGERILKVKDYIKEDIFMVTYGDGVADIDIEKLVQFHKSHGKMATITGVHPSSRWGLVNYDAENIVTEFAQKPVLYDYANGGFMVFNKEFLNYIRPGEMIEDSLAKLISQRQVALWRHEGFWYGMDTYKDFLHLNELWQKDPKWKVWQTPNQHFQKVSSKKFLITGGAGFIGSWLANDLINKGYEVAVIDNLSSSKREAVHPKATFYKADVRDKNIALIFQKENPQVVFHLAAHPLVNEVFKNPFEAIATNVMGTVNVLEICRQMPNIESIVVVSSDKAYGKSDTLPYQEDFALRGEHPYDVSKSSADLIAQTYFKTYNLPVVITRFSNVFGPGDANFSRIIPGAMRSIIKNEELLIRSDGTLIREYTYVKDIGEGCLALAENANLYRGHAFNFGSNNVFSVMEVIEKIQNILGKNINYKILNNAQNEIPKQYLDWTKAREKLQWQPKTTFEDGIKETFNWLKNLHFKN